MRFLTTLPFFILTLSLVISTSSSYAEVFYKWEDDSGSWVYGEHPPMGVEAIEIKTHSNRNNDSGSKKDELADKAANAEEAAKQQRELYCKQARENVEALSSEAAIQQRDDTGNVTMLSDKDRAIELEKAQMALESYC
ncbi:MAG: DUF4124 domain-containing protein [Pseudomonadales bacterium]|nr:DUF4124 domain-containing protein [Pseudomonadales bacterium]